MFPVINDDVQDSGLHTDLSGEKLSVRCRRMLVAGRRGTFTVDSSAFGRGGSRRHDGIDKPVQDRHHLARVGKKGWHCQRVGAQ